jgi:cytoskeleton protein RodZ
MSETSETVEPVMPKLGFRLQAAREAMGLSHREVADKLCILAPCVLALEEDNYGYFRAPIFAKGYLRSYVRLLGLEEAAALADCELLIEELEKSKPEPSRGSLKGLRKKQQAVAFLLVLAVLAIFAIYSLSTMLFSGLDKQPPEVTEKALSEQVESGVAAEAEPSQQLDPRQTEETEPVEDAPVAAGSELLQTTEAVAARSNSAVEQPAVVETLEQEVMLGHVIEMRFLKDCWIKIVDAEGSTLAVGLKKADYQFQVTGQPPFNVTVGDIRAAILSYNGRPVTMKRSGKSNLARITLGES